MHPCSKCSRWWSQAHKNAEWSTGKQRRKNKWKKQCLKRFLKAGGITIPSQLRHALNIPKGAAVEITTNEDDEIIIKKHIPTCICCGTAENVKVINGVELCQECARTFAGGTNDGNDN